MNKKDLEKLKRICDSIRTNDAKNFPQYVATPGTSPDIILSYLNRAKEALSYGSKKMAQKNADEAEQYIAKFEDLQDEFRTFMARYGEALAAAKHDLRFLRADIKAMKDSAKAKDGDPLDKISKTVNELWTKYTTKLKGSSPRYQLGATASGDVVLHEGYTGPVVAKGNAAVGKFLRELIAGKRDSVKAKDGIWTLPDTEEKYNKFKAIIKRRYEPKDVKKLTSELYRIWGQDDLFDDLEDARDSGDIAYILNSYAKDLHKYLAINKADPKLVAKAKAELG